MIAYFILASASFLVVFIVLFLMIDPSEEEMLERNKNNEELIEEYIAQLRQRNI